MTCELTVTVSLNQSHRTWPYKAVIVLGRYCNLLSSPVIIKGSLLQIQAKRPPGLRFRVQARSHAAVFALCLQLYHSVYISPIISGTFTDINSACFYLLTWQET